MICLKYLVFPSLLILSLAAQEKPASATRDEGYAQVETLARVIELVRQNYVDASKVTYPRLMAGALRGMLSELDPHSQYLTSEIFSQTKDAPELTTEDTGLTISPKYDNIVIVSVSEDGPASRAGLMSGDQLQKIGEHFTTSLTYMEAVRLLRGRPGETLRLTVWRPASRQTLALSILRETARSETIRHAMMLDPSLAGTAKIGYVRLLQFNGPTATELADALDKLEDSGMKALILDLRNNPGGLLTSTVEVCGEFLPPETVVVTTEGRVPSQNPPPLKTPAKKRRQRDYPVALLVNHASASGAELMAGALQDLGRAVIIGNSTFGKGSVQSIIPTDGGTAVRLTTAHYFTPKHRRIHEKGITPDILASLTMEEEKIIQEWNRDTPGNADPLAFAKLPDRQLERAVLVLSGVIVFQAREQASEKKAK